MTRVRINPESVNPIYLISDGNVSTPNVTYIVSDKPLHHYFDLKLTDKSVEGFTKVTCTIKVIQKADNGDATVDTMVSNCSYEIVRKAELKKECLYPIFQHSLDMITKELQSALPLLPLLHQLPDYPTQLQIDEQIGLVAKSLAIPFQYNEPV